MKHRKKWQYKGTWELGDNAKGWWVQVDDDQYYAELDADFRLYRDLWIKSTPIKATFVFFYARWFRRLFKRGPEQ